MARRLCLLSAFQLIDRLIVVLRQLKPSTSEWFTVTEAIKRLRDHELTMVDIDDGDTFHFHFIDQGDDTPMPSKLDKLNVFHSPFTISAHEGRH